MLARVGRFTAALRHEKHPLRFLAARILAETGLSRHFTIQCRGYRLRFYPTAMSAALWVDPDYRRDDIDFFAAYLRPADTVIDAGANIGFLTLFAASIVGPQGHMHSIEAHPVTAR